VVCAENYVGQWHLLAYSPCFEEIKGARVSVSLLTTVETEETTVARQRLGQHIPSAENTDATTEELSDIVFPM
jgi:hypothetical protein